MFSVKINLFTPVNKFIFTENNFLPRLIKQESYSSLHCIFQSVYALNTRSIKINQRSVVKEVWLDKKFDKYPLTQLSRQQHVRGSICFDFFFSSCDQLVNFYQKTFLTLKSKSIYLKYPMCQISTNCKYC